MIEDRDRTADDDVVDIREHVTHSDVRRRLNRQAKRSARPLVIVAITAAIGIAAAVWVVIQLDSTALVSSHQYTFQVANALSVEPGVDEVRYKGIPAGQVNSIRLVHGVPEITVTMAAGYGPIYRNATAVLRPNTPLEDMFLDVLSPGTPSAGLASTTNQVPASQTQTSVSIADVLDVFQGNVRARLADLLNGVGNGLTDRGADLRNSFIQLVPFVQAAVNVSKQLNLHNALTRQLVHNTGSLLGTLAQRSSQIRLLIGDGSNVAQTLGSNSSSLQATLADLPPTISTADSSLRSLSGVLPSVNGAVTSLEPVAQHLPTSLADIRMLTRVATPAVNALQRPVVALVPLARTLPGVSANLKSSVTTLLPQVPVLNRTVSDVGNCLTDLYGFFAWDASMAKFSDARGEAPRGNLAIGASTLEVQNGFEFAPQACTPGTAIGGALPTAADYH